MKSLLKILVIFGLVAGLLVGGAAVYVKVKFPPERVKALVEEQVKKRLGRELRLGDVSLGFWSGVSLKKVQLSERPDFAAGTFLSADGVAVEPYLLPLLHGKVAIKRVSLEKPSASVVRFFNGRFNFSDLAGSTVPAAGTAAPVSSGSSSVSLLVNQITVTGGAFSFDDRQGGMKAAVKDLSLTVDAFSLKDPFSARMSCGVSAAPAGKPALQGTVSFKGRLALGGETAEIEDLSVSLDGAALQAKGTIKNFSAPEADLTVLIKSFEGRALAPFVSSSLLKDLSVKGDLRLQGGLSQLAAQGTLQGAAAGVSTNASFRSTVQDPAGAARFDAALSLSDLKVQKSPLAADVSLSGGKAEVSAKGDLQKVSADLAADLTGADFAYGKLAAKPAGVACKLSAKLDLVAPFDRPVFEARGDVAGLALAAAPPVPADVKLGGSLALSFSARGTPDDLSADVSFDGKSVALAYGDLFKKPGGTVLSVKTSVGVKNQKDVKFSSLRLGLAGAVIDVKGTVADAPGAGRMNLTIKAAPFDVAPFGAMVPMLGGQKASGRLGVDLAAHGTYVAPTAQGVIVLSGLGAAPMEGVAFSGLTGTVAFMGDSLDAPDLKGKLNGEALSLKIFVKHFSRPEIEATGSLSALDLGKLQAALSPQTKAPAGVQPTPPPPPAGPQPIARAKGSFRVGSATHPYYVGKDFRLSWDLTDLGPNLSRLNGAAQLSAADGKIRNLPLAEKINALMKRNASDITYSKMGGHVTITQGVLSTPDFAVDSDQLDIAAKGTVNLTDLQSDLKAVFKLAKGALGGSAEAWFADEDGRVTLEASIKGPLTDPEIRPDLGKAAKRAAASYLKKVLGGGSAPASSGSNAAPSNAQDPQKAIEEGLRNLFKKKK